MEWLDELFEWIVPSCLGQIEKCDLFAPFSEAHLVRSMLNLFKALVNLDGLIANQNSEAPLQVDTIHMQMVFILKIFIVNIIFIEKLYLILSIFMNESRLRLHKLRKKA